MESNALILNSNSNYDAGAVVIGVSAGGMAALSTILTGIPASFPLPLIIVQHQLPATDNFLANYLNEKCQITVNEAYHGCPILPGNAYLAPGGYHLLIEKNNSLSLSIDLPVNYSIPSIDVLFESAADFYAEHLIGIILTGANSDGALGLKKIKTYGGLAIVQDPLSAEVGIMPQAALDATAVDYVLSLEEIAPLLVSLVRA